MPSQRLDEIRDYAFADQALALRTRTGLTQIALAAELGVTNQSVYTWEAGLSYPGAERLKQLLAFYLAHGALNAGREVEHAAEVWETVRERATRRMEPFDHAWFTSQGSMSPSSYLPDLPPTNLPPTHTRFIGREDAIAGLRTSLEHSWGADGRLLALIGVAGCGKTRLALAAAESVRAVYPDGVWFVELAPLPASSSEDPTAIASAVLAALHLRDVPDRPPLDTLIGHLASQHLLLVLDNCEHVVIACAALATRLLASCPQVQLLATSQYPLGLGDETIWSVNPLAVPPLLDAESTPELLEVVRRTEAVQLFTDRASAVQPGFTLTMETAAPISAICQELDGLPLAIELAAARMNLLSPAELLARLTDRFTVLRRGGRTVVDRHQTLQATMDWSYGLLDPLDQSVLRRLAAFAGGWDLEAAESVCTDDVIAVEAVLEALDELQARSLIFVDTTGAVPRYGMLQTVRHYGLQQLHRTGETTTVRDRHLHWCVALTEQAAIGLSGRGQTAWFARLHREQGNLRGAMQWAVDRGLAELGLRVATGLWIYWRSRSQQNEGRRWFAALLAVGGDGETDPAVRANALEGAAWLSEDMHDFAHASTQFAASSELRRDLGEDDHANASLINRALEARVVGDYQRATALLEESLARHRSQRNRESLMHGGLGISLLRLALVLNEQGKFARAKELQEECLALHLTLDDREGVAWALLGLSDIARNEGNAGSTRSHGEQALATFRDLAHGSGTGFSLNNLALAAFVEGDTDEAARYAEEGVSLFRDLDHRAGLAELLVTLGRIRRVQGDMRAARSDLAEALELGMHEGPRLFVVAALEALAVEAGREGRARDAVLILGAVESFRRTMGTPTRPADRPEVNQALKDAVKLLSPKAFGEVWSTGQTLSVEQVIERLRF